MRGSVTVHMAASADLVWDLVSDITRVGEFSPETFEAEWLGGAGSPEAGARFRGHVRRNGRGPVYWTLCTVAACNPGREFAFTVAGPGGKTVNTWRYQLQPAADGTDVTESFELPDTLLTRLYWMVAGSARGRTNRNGMRVTLEKMKAVVETAVPARPKLELRPPMHVRGTSCADEPPPTATRHSSQSVKRGIGTHGAMDRRLFSGVLVVSWRRPSSTLMPVLAPCADLAAEVG